MQGKRRNANTNTNTSELFKNPWTTITTRIIAVATIFGIGFTVGQFKESFDRKLEKNDLERQCSEKLQEEINKCREAKLAEYGKSVEELKNIFKELKDKQ